MLRQKQRGAALITVMIMVTVVIAVLAAMFHDHGIDVAKSTKIIQSEQAALLALSGESWAIDLLKQDQIDNPNVDTYLESWAYGLPLLPVEGGSLTGTLTDLQSKLNVNNLQRYTPALFNNTAIANSGNSDPKMFTALAQTQQQNFDRFQLAAVIDWLDNNDIPLPGGAEENEYLLQEPAYRPGNTLLTSNEELTLIPTLPIELLAAINPYITALPEATAINVNTAPKEVLQALHEDISESVAENLIEIRDETPWESIPEFSDALDAELLPITPGDILRQIQTPSSGAAIPNFEPVSVNSHYFQLDVSVALGSNIVELASLIHRNSANDVVVLARTLRYVPNTVPNKDADE